MSSPPPGPRDEPAAPPPAGPGVHAPVVAEIVPPVSAGAARKIGEAAWVPVDDRVLPGSTPVPPAGEAVVVRPLARPVLSVRNISIEFPGRTGTLNVVNDLSFDIAPGEVLGLVGESGAGKSVTGAAVIGLIDPPGRLAAGEIHLEGSRIDNLRERAWRKVRGRRIGFVPQDPLTSLNPLYTIGRQLVETMQAHRWIGRRAARRRAVELLSEVGIPAAARRFDAYPHEFSGGMRQRVVIALALCANPVLVIADEPTTALDVSVQAQVLGVLKRMCREHGAAVLLITHDMGVIAETADRVAVLYAGRLAEIGPVAAVVGSPLHPYTAGLMASIPRLDHAALRLPQIAGTMPRPDELPPGCPYVSRCPEVFARCVVMRPELLPVGTSRVACWLHVPRADYSFVSADEGSGSRDDAAPAGRELV